MFTHLVMFKFKSDAPADALKTAQDKLLGMVGQVPTLKRVQVALNEVSSPRAYNLFLSTEFESVEDYEVYRDHPKHQEVVAYLGTVTERAAVVDFGGAAPARP